MTTKVTDDLLGLFSICDGSVTVNVNPQKSDYESVVDWLSDSYYRKKIPAKEKVEMIEDGKIVRISFNLDRFGSQIDVFGGSVTKTALRAFALAKQLVGKEDFTFELRGYNVTALAEELGNVCRAEVHLGYNEFKDAEWGRVSDHGKLRTLEDWFINEKEDAQPGEYTPDEEGDTQYPEELVNQILQAGHLLRAHFYPNTPVGFYDPQHHDFGHLLEFSVKLAKESIMEWDNAPKPDFPAIGSLFGTPIPKPPVEPDPNNFTIIDGLRKLY